MAVTRPAALPTRRTSSLVLEHADVRWRWLPACDLRRLGAALEVPCIREYLRPLDRETVLERLLVLAHGDEWSGAALTLGVEVGGEPLGIAGVVVRGDALSTRTYLHPPLHGTGVNAAAKQVLWAVAQLARMPLVAMIHEQNTRSVAALEKLWPTIVAERVPATGRDGWCLRYELGDPPRLGPSLDASAVEDLRRLVELTPFGAVHLPALRRLTAAV